MAESMATESNQRFSIRTNPLEFAQLMKEAKSKKIAPAIAPLMICYPIALLVGILATIGIRQHKLRLKIVGVAACLGIASLVAQPVTGFPIEAASNRAFARDMVDDPSGDNATRIMLTTMTFGVHYTPWFWLALIATAGTAYWWPANGISEAATRVTPDEASPHR